nr:hypothetical protein [Tanacetum cinerariifolium]
MNLYKALVDAYESDKINLDTYGDTVTLKRRRDDANKDEEPSAGSDRGPRGEEKEKSQSQQALQRRKRPRPLGSLLKGPNLIKRLQASAADDQPIGEASQHPKWFQIIAVTKLQIVEWHNYKHLDWITVHRDDDTLYKIKEGDIKRLCIQDIKDMLLLLVQGKLTNLMVEERFAFSVSLRMFTRSIVIQRRVEDLQLGVESYQKKLNLAKPDTYHSDLKCKEAYTTYSNPRGFIYQNKDKQNRLMRIDELHKFSDEMLNDVRTALDDHLKDEDDHPKSGEVCWWEIERAATIIQAIDKQLKTRRIIQSLEKFVGGRLTNGACSLLGKGGEGRAGGMEGVERRTAGSPVYATECVYKKTGKEMLLLQVWGVDIKSSNHPSHPKPKSYILTVDFKFKFYPPMRIKGIAKVDRGWFLGCDLHLDCKEAEEDNEQ